LRGKAVFTVKELERKGGCGEIVYQRGVQPGRVRSSELDPGGMMSERGKKVRPIIPGAH